MEISLLFVMAVLTLRGFFLEGYLITTGSMAPGLLGLHKQIQCPDCGYTFAFGVSFDDSVGGRQESSNAARQQATCPNCGQNHIDTTNVPLNHGDQLLVHKGVFQFRHPRRWEAIVFRNPEDPREAYVKRAIGLPGETIRVAGGDIFVNGVIATKNYETQRDTRIQVADLKYAATSDEWSLPWTLGPGWIRRGNRLEFQEESAAEVLPPAADDLDLGIVALNFHRRSGGQHVSQVAFSPNEITHAELAAEWQRCMQQLQGKPLSWLTRLELDRDRMLLRQRGVMPFAMQQALVEASTSNVFRRAIFRLAALSHQALITDQYGYNSVVSSPEFPVQDLMLELLLKSDSLPEELEFRIPAGAASFLLKIRPLRLSAAISDEQTGRELRSIDLTSDQIMQMMSSEGLRIEISNFDHRILIVMDGEPLFAPVDIPIDLESAIEADSLKQQSQRITPTANGPSNHKLGAQQAISTSQVSAQQRRWQLRVTGGQLTVSELKLFRDVYYTPGRRRNAVESDCVVPAKNYFVMGDNSPVSSDSRNWEQPFVPDHLLLGKPFIVHLPSRPGAVNSGGSQLSLRLPDFNRIRLIP